MTIVGTKNKKMENSSPVFREMPHSSFAEMSVLGGLLIDNDKWYEVASIVNENDFYKNMHRIIYNAIGSLCSNNTPCDCLTLIDELYKQKNLDNAGGETYIFEIINNTPSASNVIAYAGIIKEKAILRKLLEAAGSIVDTVYNNSDLKINEILDIAESKIFHISESTLVSNLVTTQEQALDKVNERIAKLYKLGSEHTGLITGLKDLDDLTNGLQKKDLIVIAGRPSMGKTTLAMNIVETVAITCDKPVLIASLEMGEDQIMNRMISSIGNIEYERIFSGKFQTDDWPKYNDALSSLRKTNITFIVEPFLTPIMLRICARRAIKAYGDLGLIIIDYLQLMSLPGFKGNRTMEITTISRELKLLAKEFDVPVIVVSQLNRAVEQRVDKRPNMADLRDSGAIEQDADLILLVYRDEVYNDNTYEKGVAEILISKHRHGKVGKINLIYQGEFMRFKNMHSQYRGMTI